MYLPQDLFLIGTSVPLIRTAVAFARGRPDSVEPSKSLWRNQFGKLGYALEPSLFRISSLLWTLYSEYIKCIQNTRIFLGPHRLIFQVLFRGQPYLICWHVIDNIHYAYAAQFKDICFTKKNWDKRTCFKMDQIDKVKKILYIIGISPAQYSRPVRR